MAESSGPSKATVIVATAFGGPEFLSAVEEGVPPPGPGEVTIDVRAIGVNPIDYRTPWGAYATEVTVPADVLVP